MSQGRYYQYHQSDNPFSLSESVSESCEDTHPLHYTNPFDDDGEGEATSAAALPPEQRTLKAPPSVPKAIYRYSEYLKEEEEEEEHKEFEERQASLEKHIHSKDSLTLGIDDEFPSAATATAQSKNMEAPTYVEPISSFSEHQDEEEHVTRQVATAKSYSTRDRDLSSCPATLVQASSRHQKPNHNTERCELLETGRSDCKRIAAQGHEENRAVRDLQAYAMLKPQETLSTIKNCLRVAEQTKDAAGDTMALLHVQGDQILRTHETVVKVDQHLTVAEKILGSLGGFFSRKWKPRLACNITGPLNSGGDTFQRQGCNDAERTALGLNTNGSVKAAVGNKFAGSTGFEQHDQVKEGILREEDALTDLSNVLGQLKDMSLQMHSEISRQNEGITYLDADVHELNYRVKGANDRGRQLLRR